MYRIYACTQGDRVDLCAGLTHARRIRPLGFSILLARHVARKRNLLGAFTKLCVRTTHYVPGARNKMPHVSRFLSFVHCGRPSVSRILLRNVSQWYRRESDDPRIFASASDIKILSLFLSSFSLYFFLYFVSIRLGFFFLTNAISIDDNVVNVTRLLSAIS